MGYCVRIPDGIISMAESDFQCPKCGHGYNEEDYYNRLVKSKRYYIYKTCKTCSTKMGISVDYRGDVQVWLKEDESKIQKIVE